MYDFSDVKEVTVMSDNVLPAVLRKLGILKVTDKQDTTLPNPTLGDTIQQGFPVPHSSKFLVN